MGKLMAKPRRQLALNVLDRMVDSPGNYWVGLFGDLAAAFALLALGLHRFSGHGLVATGVVLVGFLSCSLLEYVVHRWVLHGPPSIARRGHAQHHATPQALISTPLFVIMGGMLVTWRLLGLVLSPGTAALLVSGLYAGYNYFALVHHALHRRGADLLCPGYVQRLERLHDRHHAQPAVNFGISTTLWDHVFGTFQPASETVTAEPCWGPIAACWMKLTHKRGTS